MNSYNFLLPLCFFSLPYHFSNFLPVFNFLLISIDLVVDKKNSIPTSNSSLLVQVSSISSTSSDLTQGLNESTEPVLTHSSAKAGTGSGTGSGTGTGTGGKSQTEGLDQDINATECKYIREFPQ